MFTFDRGYLETNEMIENDVRLFGLNCGFNFYRATGVYVLGLFFHKITYRKYASPLEKLLQ